MLASHSIVYAALYLLECFEHVTIFAQGSVGSSDKVLCLTSVETNIVGSILVVCWLVIRPVVINIGVLLIVVEQFVNATGQGQRLNIQIVGTKHANLSFQGDNQGVEFIESSTVLFPEEGSLEHVYHAIEFSHSQLVLSNVM